MSRLRPVYVLVVLLALLLLSAWHLFPNDSVVQIEAQTEVLRVLVPRGEPLEWPAGGYELSLDCMTPALEAQLKQAPRDRRLFVRGPARVEFTRAGDNGPLRITVSPRLPDSPAAGDSCAEAVVTSLSSRASFGELPIHGALSLRLEFPSAAHAGEPAQTFPLRGEPTIGDDVASGVEYMLLSGQATVIQTTHWRWLVEWLALPLSFVADTRTLGTGDRVVPRSPSRPVAADKLDDRGLMTGFVRVSAGKPMTVVLQGALRSVDIYRFNNSPAVVEGSLWSRIRSDPLLSYLLGALGVVYALGQFVLHTPWKRARGEPTASKDEAEAEEHA